MADGVRAERVRRGKSAIVELHFIGEIANVSIPGETSLVRVHWGIAMGPSWRHVQGMQSGTTHASFPAEHSTAVLSHPLDVHLASVGLAGWPRLWLKVFSSNGAKLLGYGVVNLPCTPGTHSLSITLWVPHAGPLEAISYKFFGGKGVRLVHEDAAHSQVGRYRLQSRSTGAANVYLSLLTKDFDRFAIATG